MQSVKTYFITGATGAVGSALVPVLLEQPNTRLELLIRAASETELAERLESLFAFWEIPPDQPATRQRITALRGDVTLPRLGLDDGVYARLCADCTQIIHAAGNVRMNLPIEEARRFAVDATRHLVALARTCPRLEKLEFVSTVGVGGRMPLVPERWLAEPRQFHNTYEQSKAEAEDVLREAMEQDGLPVTVHRPSMVVGDSRTGKIIHRQVFYYLCQFLSGRQTLGILPDLHGVTLDTIPVDHVARILCWSSTQRQTVGKVLHLCAGPEEAVEIPWLVEAVREAMAREGVRLPGLKRVPLWVFRGGVPVLQWLAPVRVRKALKNLDIFLDYAGDRQAFENLATLGLLGAEGVSAPEPRGYLDAVIVMMAAG